MSLTWIISKSIIGMLTTNKERLSEIFIVAAILINCKGLFQRHAVTVRDLKASLVAFGKSKIIQKHFVEIEVARAP